MPSLRCCDTPMHFAGTALAVAHNADGTCTQVESSKWVCSICGTRVARPEDHRRVACEEEVYRLPVPIRRRAFPGSARSEHERNGCRRA